MRISPSVLTVFLRLICGNYTKTLPYFSYCPWHFKTAQSAKSLFLNKSLYIDFFFWKVGENLGHFYLMHRKTKQIILDNKIMYQQEVTARDFAISG